MASGMANLVGLQPVLGRVKVAEVWKRGNLSVTSTAAAGTFVDMAAGYTLTVTCQAGDRVVLFVEGMIGVTSNGSNQYGAGWVFDKDSGTKLPSGTPLGMDYFIRATASDDLVIRMPTMYIDDNVTAGDHVYKLQGQVVFNTGSQTIYFGEGVDALFRVEVWR